MLDVLRIVSIVMMWIAVTVNIYASVINYKGYLRNKKIYEDLSEYWKHLTDSEK